MRFCPKCGAENPDTAILCKQCVSPLQQSGGKTCPSGRHTMDPTWTECVYCKQENVAPTPSFAPVRQATVVESQPPSRLPNRPPTYKEDTPLPPRRVEPPKTPPGPAPVSVDPRVNRQRANTVYRNPNQPESDTAPALPQIARDRRIVGVLVTYSWTPEGQIFPIREGRNFIGRDTDCEVCVSEDQTMSGRNSHITYRQNFVVGDMVSMTGTDLDGVPIEEQFRSLPNYANIRAGSTHFVFIAIEP